MQEILMEPSITVKRPHHILLVDDEKPIRSLAMKVLVGFYLGSIIEARENGQELVDYARQHAKELTHILTDYNMPILTGLEAIKTLRKEGIMTPALILSAQPFDVVSSLNEFPSKRYIEIPNVERAYLTGKPYSILTLKSFIDQTTAQEALD